MKSLLNERFHKPILLKAYSKKSYFNKKINIDLIYPIVIFFYLNLHFSRLYVWFGKLESHLFPRQFLVDCCKCFSLKDEKSCCTRNNQQVPYKSKNESYRTLCSMLVIWFLSKCTLMRREPSNLIRMRLPTISAGKTRSSRMASCTAVNVRLQAITKFNNTINKNSTFKILKLGLPAGSLLLIFNFHLSSWFR